MPAQPARALLVCGALVVALALAGCAGNKDKGGSSSTPSPTSTSSSSTTAASSSSSSSSMSNSSSTAPRAPKTWTVTIQGSQFVEGTITIQKGDTVHWVHNDGTTPHSVKADDGSFDSDGGLPCPGAGCMTSAVHSTYDHKFDADGSFPYHCEVHPGSMKNTITVVDALPNGLET